MYENVQWDRDYLLTFKNPENGKIFQIRELRMSFDIEMFVDNKEKTNKGTISIYNLKDETLAEIKTRFGNVSLEVGYKGNIKTLVNWEVINIQTKKQGNDKVTTFEITNSYTELSVKKISYSFPEDIFLGNVVDKIAADLGLSLPASKTGEWRTFKCIYGYPAYGTGKQVLDEIAKTYAIEWKINDGVLIVTDRYGLSGGEWEKAIVLTKETGLLDYPFSDTEEVSKSVGQALDKDNELFLPRSTPLKPKKDGTPRKISKYRARRYGVRVRALLNPEVRPNSLFKVVTDDEMFNDFYRVRSVSFKGDTRGGEWWMELWGDSKEAEEQQ